MVVITLTVLRLKPLSILIEEGIKRVVYWHWVVNCDNLRCLLARQADIRQANAIKHAIRPT